MARTFEQVLADVTKQSDPQRQTILRSIADIPSQQLAEEASLTAKKDQAYTDILDGARRRGTGVAFGGIPLGEQAQYAATEYAPAVARMKTGFNERKGTLESALADIGKNDYSSAYSIFNTDRQFEEQQRQFNEQMAENRKQAAAARAAQSASLADYFGGGNQAAGSFTPQSAKYEKTQSGFRFFDASGMPINAAQFAKMTSTGYRQLLSEMSKAGDKNAGIALKYVGNDAMFGNAPESIRGALSALGATGTYAKPAPQKRAPTKQNGYNGWYQGGAW